MRRAGCSSGSFVESRSYEPRGESIRVLLVEDSATVRRALRAGLSRYPDIEIVGEAVNPYEARDEILRTRPHVLTLDLELPLMDGLSFLEWLMRHLAASVVVLSSLTPKNSRLAIRALELGAMEVLCKPDGDRSLAETVRHLAVAIRAAALGRPPKPARPHESVERLGERRFPERRVLALGASTGGARALETILGAMPAGAPAMVVAQHMPEMFTEALANRLDDLSALRVTEARDGDRLEAGRVLIAPGNRHIRLDRDPQGYRVLVKGGPRVHFQRPSVDVLFRSVARVAGADAVGALLTGMGRDGARGLLEMREAGARTLAEDESTTVVFGMPKVAIELGAAEQVVPLDQMAAAMLSVASGRSQPAVDAGKRLPGVV